MTRTGKLICAAIIGLVLIPSLASAQGVLYVKNGKVGINEDAPSYDLEVEGVLQVKKTGGTANVRFLSGSGQTWNFQNNGSNGAFAIRDVTASKTPFKIEAGAPGNLFTLTSGGQVEVLGSAVHPDFVFEPVYDLESIEAHADYMWTNKHLPAVGAGRYDESGRPIIQLGASTAGMLEELEKAHIYIDHLNSALKQAQTANQDLESRIARMEALLAP